MSALLLVVTVWWLVREMRKDPLLEDILLLALLLLATVWW